MTKKRFLADIQHRPLALPTRGSLVSKELYVGPGQQGLEVAVISASDRPPDRILQAAWVSRRARRAMSVLLVALYGEVARALKQVSSIASSDHSLTPVIDFEEDEKGLHITDRFFAFYLRWGRLGE